MERNRQSQDTYRPFVSVVLPAYNEEEILQQNLTELYEYMRSLENEYRWEIILVDDGSTDNTGIIADDFAQKHPNFQVIHQPHNFRLGQALRAGFHQCEGDYVVTLDIDLSYAPDHIEQLLRTLREEKAKVVIASPYMKGGQVSNVPFLRKQLSIWANRFLSLTVTKDRLTGKIFTLTGMVRGYDRKFLSKLDLKAMDVDINTEILYKTMILRGRITEIPAHLNWRISQPVITSETREKKQRKSSMRIFKGILSSLLSGFIFRPFMFFILPGLVVLMLSIYTVGWAFVHTFTHYQKLAAMSPPVEYDFSDAIAAAFNQGPHVFIVGGFSLVVAIQLISLGILALQNKKYFEELFHLGSSVYADTLKIMRRNRDPKNPDRD